MNNWDYPLGADTDNAPWNKSEKEVMEFDCLVSEEIQRNTSIMTSSYTVREDEICTDHIDWDKEYKAHSITFIDIVKEMKRMLKEEQKTVGARTGRGAYIHRLIETCNEYLNATINTNVEKDD